MPASVNQPNTPFSFLPASATAADGSRSSGDRGFAQMLQGQMSARADQQAHRTDYTRHADSAARGSERQPVREPQRETARTPERSRPADKATASQTERATDDNAAREASGDGAASVTDAGAPQNTTTPADTAPAQAQPASPGPAEAAGLAGLPAAIAALLAGGQTAKDGAPAAGGGLQPSDAADDTLSKSLQNPAGDFSRFATDADAAGRAAQLTAQLQGKPDAAGSSADPQGVGLAARGGELHSGLQAAAGALAGTRHPTAGQPAVAQLPVNTPAGQAAFADDVGDRVVWMLGRAESKAELVLTPPTLGKVEVSINLSGDQTTAQFVASSQAARDALEQAMPRLREVLQQAGISLGQTSVGTSGDQQAAQDDGGRRGRSGGTAAVGGGEGGGASRWIRQSEGIVDTFA